MPIIEEIKLQKMVMLVRWIDVLNNPASTNEIMSDEGAKAFAATLQYGFTLTGSSVRDLAKDVGISKATISKWQGQKHLPNMPTRNAVIDWLKSRASRELAGLIS